MARYILQLDCRLNLCPGACKVTPALDAWSRLQCSAWMDLITWRAFMRVGLRLNRLEVILLKDFIGQSQTHRAVLKATTHPNQEGWVLSFDLLIRRTIDQIITCISLIVFGVSRHPIKFCTYTTSSNNVIGCDSNHNASGHIPSVTVPRVVIWSPRGWLWLVAMPVVLDLPPVCYPLPGGLHPLQADYSCVTHILPLATLPPTHMAAQR